MIKYEERDSFTIVNKGQKIFGITHIPLHCKKPPVVLMCHGLGGHKTGRYRVYVELAEALVRNKIAVVRFDFRGSGDSEGNLSEITLKDQFSDAIAVLNHIKNSHQFDTKAMGIFGRSLGAAVAIQSAAQFKNIKSLALWVPLFNGLQWESQWSKVKNGEISEQEAVELRRINGQVASLEFYSQLFSIPTEQALSQIQEVPLLLIHGEQDTLISIEHSELYVKTRKSSPAKTVFIRLPHGDHDFSHTEERISAIIETAKWFKNTLIKGK